MSWLRFLFGWHGRVNRLQLLLGVYGFGFVNMIATMIAIFALLPATPGGGYEAGPQFVAAYYIASAPWIISSVSLLARRAHDLGLSSSTLLLLPAYVLVLEMMFAVWPALEEDLIGILLEVLGVSVFFAFVLRPGQIGANRFGPVPQPGWLPS